MPEMHLNEYLIACYCLWFAFVLLVCICVQISNINYPVTSNCLHYLFFLLILSDDLNSSVKEAALYSDPKCAKYSRKSVI